MPRHVRIEAFSTISDLDVIFAKGVRVEFVAEESMFILGSVEGSAYPFAEGSPFYWVRMRNRTHSQKNEIDDQKATLIHELLHIYNHEIGACPFRRSLVSDSDEESLIESHAQRIAKVSSDLFYSIVCKLVTLPHCHIAYEGDPAETAFWSYHKWVVGKLLLDLSVQQRLVFGDPRTVNILRSARWMGLL